MSYLYRERTQFEIPITGIDNAPFYARVNAKVRDPKVLREAKKIVDFVRPQKFGLDGAHYYSFLEREHLLNLILRFFDKNHRLPRSNELNSLIAISRDKRTTERDHQTFNFKVNHLGLRIRRKIHLKFIFTVLVMSTIIFNQLSKISNRLNREVDRVKMSNRPILVSPTNSKIIF